MTNRRNFLRAAGLGIAVAAVPGIKYRPEGKKEEKKFRFKLGMASYTLRKFSLEEALDMTLRCGVNRITLKSMHLPLDSDKRTIKNAASLCDKKSITLYGGGVIYMKTKDEVDQAFEYARTAGMDIIIGVPAHELLGYVEEKVKKYDIKLAIHNHGPGDKLYPSAESAYTRIKNMDKRMGLCIDIGHTKRINRDPVLDLKDFADRVHDIHIKDVTAPSANGTTCIIGRGVIDFPSFMETVVKSRYKGTLALEYEADADDPLPGMMESLGYVKGIMSML
jgi:inosose dehydratase